MIRIVSKFVWIFVPLKVKIIQKGIEKALSDIGFQQFFDDVDSQVMELAMKELSMLNSILFNAIQ